jgi:hypothetical protein
LPEAIVISFGRHLVHVYLTSLQFRLALSPSASSLVITAVQSPDSSQAVTLRTQPVEPCHARLADPIFQPSPELKASYESAFHQVLDCTHGIKVIGLLLSLVQKMFLFMAVYFPSFLSYSGESVSD